MNNQTVKQLKEVCDQKGIKYTSKTKKEELIAMLQGSKPEASVGTTFSGEY